ncbi:LysE family translocator [Oceanomicrobium pacificus]|uniref:LysE family transporter n=1 Tax=Oceanomicrobium pacificus TaxID=2692916 RepID=A0A6B0TVX2_9RHOB|nr:LysE family transporter [Oceanomicrobium pacificus]MXU65905.1 LysE family transporter [Oceanomicrobium pacificus]
MTDAFVAALVGVIFAQLAPGPNLLAVAAAGLADGRRAALGVVFGVATGILVWAALAAIGLGAVIAALPAMFTVLKLVGGGYLLWLGAKALWSLRSPTGPALKGERRGLTLATGWRRGIIVVLTNPKAAVMWAAVGAFLFGAGLNAAQVMAFGPLAALTAIAIYGGYGLLFSSRSVGRGYARAARIFDAGFGLAFTLLGGSLVVDALRRSVP